MSTACSYDIACMGMRVHACGRQVWLQLEEKQIPYVIEKINMRCYGCDTEHLL